MSNAPRKPEFQIDFCAEMREDEMQATLERRVVPPSGDYKGVCLSVEPVSLRLHHYGDHSVPHLIKNCVPCLANNQTEFALFLWFHVLHLKTVVALQVPAGPAPAIKRALEIHGTLQGLPMTFWRRPEGRKGRVRVSIADRIDPRWSMMPTPSLPDFLARMYGKHLRVLAAKITNAASAMSEAEQSRVERDAPGDAPITARGPRARTRPRRNLDSPIAIGDLISTPNGHAAERGGLPGGDQE